MNKKTSFFIISFCYSYIIGVVLDMLFPMTTAFGSSLWLIASVTISLTGILTLAIALGFLKFKSWFVVFALSSAVLFGYVRHKSVNTNPDIKIADFSFANNNSLQNEIVLKDTARLKIVKSAPSAQDFKVKLSGKISARILAPNSNPLNADGKWIFAIEDAPVASSFILIKASDPVGTSYDVSAPFNVISAIETNTDKVKGSIAIWCKSNHARAFARAGRYRPSITVLGQITQDPQVRESKTMLTVTAQYIQYVDHGPFYKTTGGDVQVMLYPTTKNYQEFAQTAAYGYNVICRGELRKPQTAANPGDFDQKRYMYNHNYAGTLFLNRKNGIEAIKKDGKVFAKGNKLVEFSLDLRDKMLLTIKQTLPLPHSAFVAAVTLGMRYGLAEAPSLFSDYYDCLKQGYSKAQYVQLDTVHYGSESMIASDFKRAGVNHVLAVSGLHVTIITAMFIGIFSIIKIPRKMFVPPTILALIIFAIITGARPSTLRAVIMNSLFLLTWAYLARGLRSAALFGVAVSGFLILIHNPLMIVDPSFTLSFGAILSLVLLTGPSHAALSTLKGNVFIVFWVFLALTTILGISHFGLYMQPLFVIPYLLFWGLIAFSAHKLQAIFHPIDDIGYSDLPKPFSNFFAAQFAIQFGMMLPLSAYYFGQWPFGGVFANLIAIPLIGIIVQLGVIAGLMGLIPGIGLYIALILSASNWIFSYIFLFISHAVAHVFPYPFLPKPSTWGLVFYYILCFLVVYYRPWSGSITKLLSKFGINKKWASATVIGFILLLLALPLFIGHEKNEKLKITLLSVRYGSAILVQTPNHANLLFDASAITRGVKTFNTAERTVIPFLTRQGIFDIDAAVITSPNVQRAAGMTEILNFLSVETLFVPDSIYGLSSNIAAEEFKNYILKNKNDQGPDSYRYLDMYRELIHDTRWPNRPSLMKMLKKQQPTFLNKIAGSAPTIKPLTDKTIIWQETDHKGINFTVQVIHPDLRQFEQKNVENRATVIKITYGEFSMILPSDLHFLGQEHLRLAHKIDQLECDVFVIPGHAAQLPASEYLRLDSALSLEINANLIPLIHKTKAQDLIVEYGDPRYVCPSNYREMRSANKIIMRRLDALGKNVYTTERDQAIIIASDGKKYKITTQRALQKDAGQSSGDGTSDIGYGF